MTSLSVTRPSPELPAGPRAALIVATGRYSDTALPQLDAVALDADAMRRVLADPDIGGFDVTSVVHGNVQEVRLAVEDFLKQRQREDMIVVYLSCHGLLDEEDQLYFAAADTRKDRLASTGVEARWLSLQLQACRAARQVVILDCCNSGAFGQATGGKGEAGADLRLKDRFPFIPEGRGRAVLTASRANQPSYEGERVDGISTTSVFTSALVEGLRTGDADADTDGFISADEAYDYAYQKVITSDVGQVPQKSIIAGEGKLLLARNPAGLPIVPATSRKETRALPPISNLRLEKFLDQPWFVGRKDELDKCQERLSERPFLIIYGLDGQGKTTLARVYAAEYSNYYDVIWFIPASRESGVSEALKKLAEELRPVTAPRERLIALREELTNRDRWLLIFDDVRGWESIEDYIPPLRGHIIVTTNSIDWKHNVRDLMPGYLHLRGLPRAASKKYLMDRIDGATDSAAERLAANVDDSPDALVLAAVELAPKGGIPEAYNNDEALRTLWEDTIDRLQDRYPLALSLLEFCSLFASDPIPEKVLTLPPSKPGPSDGLRVALADPDRYSDLVDILRGSSLLEAPLGSGEITVHRRLQTYLLENMPYGRKRDLLPVAIDLLLDTFYQSWFRENFDRCARALSHAESCLKIAVRECVALEQASALMTGMAHYHRTRGNIFKARDLHRQALEVRENKFGKDSPKLAPSLINLGLVLTEMGDPGKAIGAHERALEILASAGPPSEITAICRDNLGLALAANGQYAQAIDRHKQAYDFWYEKNELHSNVAQALDNMGHALYLLGDYLQADKVLQKAIEIGRQAVEAGVFDKLDLAEMLHNQGQILRAQGGVYDAFRARPILEEALSLRSGEFGNLNLSAIETRTARARVLRCLGEHECAAEEADKARQAMDGLRQSDPLGFGPPGLPDLSSRYLCALLIAEGELRFAWGKGKYADAKQRLEQAKELADTSVPPLPSVEYAELMENLGRVYNAESRGTGEDLLKKAAGIRAKLNEVRVTVPTIPGEVDR